ncbi:MAG: ABC transporter permease [Treponemataceae bacterium]|nr:ABC transporter permease [Treponemataceae bacterium]
MLEDLINTFQNFKQNKTRTFLSLLGVIIGVASVIIITTLGRSATANVKESFGSSGLDVVKISSGFMNRRSSSSSVQFNENFRKELWNNIDNLKQIQYLNSLSSTLVYGDLSVTSTASAIEHNYLQMYNFELECGSFFSVSDNVQGNQKIILGKEISEALFPEGDPLGKTITLINSDIRFGFEVIGVLKESSSSIESTSSSVYIPRGFYIKKIQPNPNASTIVCQTVDQKYAVQAAEDIEAYFEQKTGLENSVMVMSMASFIEQYDEIMGTLTLLLSGVAAISLLVGGVGIMNIMIVTVTERKKEIGIRKALGARPNAIRMQFLVESATISLCGGLLGVIVGIIISAAVVLAMNWQFSIQWAAVFLSFIFSAFVGVFFGLNPASRAAKLDPVQALASE